MGSQLSEFVYLFCRAGLSFAFLYAAASKLLSFGSFQRTIVNFGLLPAQSARWAAILFVGGEMAVFALLILGGRGEYYGYLLAISLLLVFSLALASALLRGIETACNCFGDTQEQIAPFDIWRNAGLGALAALGLYGLSGWQADGAALSMPLSEIVLTCLLAIAVITLWVNAQPFWKTTKSLFTEG